MEGGELNGLSDREMDGGRDGRRAGAGKTTREAQGQREEDREKGKAQGSPAAASVHRRIPTSLVSLQPACCSYRTDFLSKTTARLQTACIKHLEPSALSVPSRSASSLQS